MFNLDRKKLVIIAICFITAIGFFIRAYNFHDWLRFNADQSRDAALTEGIIEGEGKVPLYGPRAGGTEFRLGPAFYYFQLVSAKIFGASPDKMAYPDLFFSVLSIPLFYLLSRIFFNRKISLAITFLFAFSYFNIKYSRFAWNPNSTSFFIMLFFYSTYLFLRENENSRKLIWVAIAGSAIGIGIQLHTSLLVLLPVLAFLVLYLMLRKKLISKRHILIFALMVIFLNIPQIIGEIKSGGMNTYQSWLAFTEKNERNTSFRKNFLMDVSCHVQANFHILTSLGNENICGYKPIFEKFGKIDSRKIILGDKITFVSYVAVAAVFSIFGYFLLFKKCLQKKENEKNIILCAVSLYVILTFFLFLVMANELSIRFFLALGFMPFFLLGFIFEFLSEKTKKEFLIVGILASLIFIVNVKKINAWYGDLKNGGHEINGDFQYITLGEAEYIVKFIEENKENEKKIIIDAQAGYLFKFIKSLKFLAKQKDFQIIEYSRNINLPSGSQSFYVKSAEKSCRLPENKADNFEVISCSLYGQFAIFKLKAI